MQVKGWTGTHRIIVWLQQCRMDLLGALIGAAFLEARPASGMGAGLRQATMLLYVLRYEFSLPRYLQYQFSYDSANSQIYVGL